MAFLVIADIAEIDRKFADTLAKLRIIRANQRLPTSFDCVNLDNLTMKRAVVALFSQLSLNDECQRGKCKAPKYNE